MSRPAALTLLLVLASCTTYTSTGPGLGFINGDPDGGQLGDLTPGSDAAGADVGPLTDAPLADVPGADVAGTDLPLVQNDAPNVGEDLPIVVADVVQPSDTGPTTVCGNGICEGAETQTSCPMDCPKTGPVCGNGVCENGETQGNCPADCTPAWVCGNGICESAETAVNCPADCKPKVVCGNGVCESGETEASCAADCKPKVVCGNGVCESGETAASCPTDCKVAAKCGDGSCVSGESAATCALDCSSFAQSILPCVQANCPTSLATCLGSNTCTTALNAGAACAAKCQPSDVNCLYNCQMSFGGNVSAGAVAQCAYQAGCFGTVVTNSCGNGVCDNGETAATCAADCVAVSGCGDGTCNNGENATSCPLDCNTKVASMLSCVKTTCPTEYAACSTDAACMTAANAAMGCVSKCGSSDFACLLGCQNAGGGNTKFSALTQCSLTCFLMP